MLSFPLIIAGLPRLLLFPSVNSYISPRADVGTWIVDIRAIGSRKKRLCRKRCSSPVLATNITPISAACATAAYSCKDHYGENIVQPHAGLCLGFSQVTLGQPTAFFNVSPGKPSPTKPGSLSKKFHIETLPQKDAK